LARRKELQYLLIGMVLFGLAFGLLAGAGNLPLPVQAAQKTDPSGTGTPRTEVVVVRLYFRDAAERDRLATEWGAAEYSTKDGYLTIWTDRASYNQMLAEGLHAEIDQEQTQQANNPNLFGQDSPDTFYGGYKTVEEMQTFLNQQVAAHPTLAQVVDFGDSWCKTHAGACTAPAPTWNGYDLLALHITNQAIAGPKPVFWFDTAIHSREIATPEMAMRYISWLLDNYDTNADAHWLVDWHDIWIVPMLNPDGHHMVEAGGNNPYLQRKNGDRDDGCTSWPPGGGQLGTDINRNFPFLWACCGGSSGSACNETYRGPSAGSEDETQAVTNQIRLLIPDQRGPNITDAAPLTTTGVYQSMHSNAALNLFPWGFQVAPHAPNDADLRNIAAHMAAINAGGNGYDYGQPPEVLYAVDGDTADWGYGELGIASYTTEVGGSSFFPAYSTLAAMFTLNQGAFIYQSKIARTPYLTTRGPDANTVAASPPSVPQGTPSNLTATINYAWTGNTYAQTVAAAEYYIDTPPWAGGTAIPMTGSFTGQTVAVQATVDTTALSAGRHILFVRGRGVNSYSGNLSWGPISAVFLDVIVQGTPTPTVTGTPPTTTSTVTPPVATATGTPTTGASATPTATVCSGQQVIQGSVDGSDPGHADYLDVQADPDPSVCGTVQTCPGVGSDPGPYHYELHTFTNNSGSSTCITVDVDGSGCASIGISVAAYLTSFDPNNLCTNYLGDSGGTPIDGTGSFSFDVPAGATFVLDVEEWQPDIGCASYTLTVSGLTCGTTPTVTPPAATNTPTVGTTATSTAPPATSTTTATAQPTSCPIQFIDAPPGSTFYDYIRCLACRGIVGGYPCGGPGEPCPGQYYRPNNNVTRGQVSKIVSESAGFADAIPSTQQTFEDVPPSGTFWLWVERLSSRGIIGGYACGGPFEPCVTPNNRPYFRPNNDVTRGQLSKIVAGAAGWTETPTTQTFEDVPVGSTFYVYIERIASRGIVTGYPCGGPFEPCVTPGNRPYFRPNNQATRGQMAKIAAAAFFPGCSTPAMSPPRRSR
jgi:hypothetical protein